MSFSFKLPWEEAFNEGPRVYVTATSPFSRERTDLFGKPVSNMGVAKTKFYDEATLDYLLDDIIKQKAKEAEAKLNKEIEERKRNHINDITKHIKNVYFNDPYTIIVWKDGEKTIVKCQEGDVYDKEKGFALAMVKHFCGNTNYFNTIFKKWVPEDNE